MTPTTNPVVRRVRALTPVALSGWLISACAGLTPHGTPVAPAPAAPTHKEVVEYVQAHWSDYSKRTAFFQQRPKEDAFLVSVQDVSCEPYYGIPECRFTVTVSIGGRPPVDQRLVSTFDREPDGTLFETIVLVHERRR